MVTEPTPRSTAPAAQVMPLVALMATALVCACALAVDLGASYRAEASQKQALELAKESVMSDLVELKFSEDGARATAARFAEALAADGWEGELTVWAAELPESTTGDLDRLQVVHAAATQTHESVLAEVMGSDSTTISSTMTFSTNYYSSTSVWRPAGSADGTTLELEYAVAGGEATLERESSPARGQMPDAIFDEANDALPRLSGCGGTDKRYEK